MTDAISGERGAYVPCFELPAALPDDPSGAITGMGAGFVSSGEAAASLPDEPPGAATGSSVGFVAKPCDCCGGLTGSTGLIDPGTPVTGSHTVIQSTALTLDDDFGRTIPYVDPSTLPAPPPPRDWYQFGVADTGQQWWSNNVAGTGPGPIDTVELDGSSVLATNNHGPSVGVLASGIINAASDGAIAFEDYDFGWNLADIGFDATMDVWFELYGATLVTLTQWTMSVKLATSDASGHPTAEATYRVRRSTDDTQLFLSTGTGTTTFTLPVLTPGVVYRIRWQVTGPLCLSRARIWAVGDPEPTTWDGSVTLTAPMPANAAFGITMNSKVIELARIDALHLTPTNLFGHGSVSEDSVTQIGARQYQLRNSYLPGTLVAFVEHAGYPLVLYSRFQATPNIVEDDPVVGIFSFPASISYVPTYNPTIGLGTVVSACYIVPPDCG